MGQDGTTHQNRDLLHDFDTRVTSLPGLLTLTHGLQEGNQSRDSERRGHHGKGSRSGVTHVLIQVVDIRPHGSDHRSKSSSLSQVGDDLPPLHTSIVVLINQQRLYDHQDLMYIGAHKVVELVEHAINDFDEEMSLLVFEGRGHEQGKDLVEQRSSTKLTCLVCELAKGLFSHCRSSVFNLEKQLHDLTLLGLSLSKLLFILVLQQWRKVLIILGLYKRKVAGRCRRHIEFLIAIFFWNMVEGSSADQRRRCSKQLSRRSANGDISGRSLENFVAFCWKHGIEFLVCKGPVPLVDFPLPSHGIVLFRSKRDRHTRQLAGGRRCKAFSAYRSDTKSAGCSSRRHSPNRGLIPSRPGSLPTPRRGCSHVPANLLRSFFPGASCWCLSLNNTARSRSLIPSVTASVGGGGSIGKRSGRGGCIPPPRSRRSLWSIPF
mmetsp:Transcript_46162/g.75324  ORF Transcript_46162/g.75324 Transcript_46162/m.75324 type:complete len:433 (+) Transcript_46162:2227-3525(+)